MLIGWYSSRTYSTVLLICRKKSHFKWVFGSWSPIRLLVGFFFRKCEFFCKEFLKYFKDFRALCIMKLVVVTHTVSTHIGKHALYNFWQLKIEINASTSPLNFKNISKSSFFRFDSIKKIVWLFTISSFATML